MRSADRRRALLETYSGEAARSRLTQCSTIATARAKSGVIVAKHAGGERVLAYVAARRMPS